MPNRWAKLPHPCPFCELDEVERILTQDDHSSVILSNPRLMPGHLLVVPHRHMTALWEIAPVELASVFRHINVFERKLLAAGYGTGCDIRQNYRPFLEDSRLKVSHLHFHIYPRTMEDQLFRQSQTHETELFLDLTPVEQADVMRKLA
jgi:diadenosine tetraphosphate (Ap4A) HIT family hydrolase